MAPGKINVHLSVGALRSDGYHDLATVFQAVSLYETVEATAADDFSVVFEGPLDTSELSSDGENLAIRAARAVAEAGGVEGGVALRIEKRLPIAGGMAGGSADAAATLVACDELWRLGLGRAKLLEMGAELGADVPFALTGGMAVGTGRGDRLSTLLHRGCFHWVLVFADGELSTPVVFNELDEHRWRTSRDTGIIVLDPTVPTAVMQALRLGDVEMLSDAMHNDLQAAALRLMPRLMGTLELGERLGAAAGIVSGSGPTCAFLCESSEEAEELVRGFAAQGVEGHHVTGPVAGARVVS